MIGVLVYYDGVYNDSRMNVSIGVMVGLYGVMVVNYLEVKGLLKGEDGRLRGVEVVDNIGEWDGK